MPAQTAKATAAHYTEGDTAPPLTAQLIGEDGLPVNLTSATIVINIAFAMPRGTYYTSPRDRIVSQDACQIVGDPTLGNVSWTPGTVDGTDRLSPPGQFLYQFEVTYSGGGVQTIPSNTYLPLIIKSAVGGRAYQ